MTPPTPVHLFTTHEYVAVLMQVSFVTVGIRKDRPLARVGRPGPAHQRRPAQQHPDLPVKSVRSFPFGKHAIQLIGDPDEGPRPQRRHEQRPVQVVQRSNLVVSAHQIVVSAAPGQCEFRGPVIQVGGLKIEEAGELLS
jgi:hypothetical protein